MPVLLAPDGAPLLSELLANANGVGLDTQVVAKPGQPEPRIQGLGSLSSAGPAEISFLSNPRLQTQLQSTRAAAVIVTPQVYQSLEPHTLTWFPVVCSQPYLMYAMLAQWFDRHRIAALESGIHPSAIIHPTAQVGQGVSVGPQCVIEQGVRIGDGGYSCRA